MSFRTRLTSFFAVIVVLPMVAIGILVLRLISDSEQGKAAARANGLATAAASLYENESATNRAEAQVFADAHGLFVGRIDAKKVAALASRAGLARVTLTAGSRRLADVGDRTAIAPGSATVSLGARRTPVTVTVSQLTATRFGRDLAAPDVAVVVRQGGRILTSTLGSRGAQAFPRDGTVALGGVRYRAATVTLPGFGGVPVDVTVLSDLAATSVSVGASQAVAVAFIVGFLLLAFSFSIVASRALQGQLNRFLKAARRLAGGDFSAQIETEGRDEFAALGEEFNNMSGQLARRLDELSQERGRLRESIRRIGETFASNLDRPALLDLALKTAMDAVQAVCGRLSVRSSPEDPLVEAVRGGSFDGFEDGILDAERAASTAGGLGERTTEQTSIVSVSLGPLEPGRKAHGVITVARRERPFNDEDRELLRSLATQATLALENIELHVQVSRQAVTDELTGLANHGRFQELLGAEMEQVRRYEYPVGLIMLDIDDFKSINDTYGHQQRRRCAPARCACPAGEFARPDSPARYGGEEMALILPHTDLEGSYVIAERVRTAIEGLRIPRSDNQGLLRITASVGVAATSEGGKEALVADADAALYDAKRRGKNCTIRAPARATNVSGAE